MLVRKGGEGRSIKSIPDFIFQPEQQEGGEGDAFRLIWTCLYGDGVERVGKRRGGGVAVEGRVGMSATFNLLRTC